MSPLKKLVALKRDEARAVDASSRARSSSAARVLLALATASALLSAGLGLLLARAVGEPLARLAAEPRGLRDAVTAGELSRRGDLDRIAPEFRPIIQGMNETMDAFVAPISVTAEYVDRISRGDVPPPILQAYQGQFDTTRQALNRCIAAVNAVLVDGAQLAQAGVAGQLSVRADSSLHQGEFRRIVQGMNDTLDAVVTPLAAAAGYVDQIAQGHVPPPIDASYRGDFEVLRKNLNAKRRRRGGAGRGRRAARAGSGAGRTGGAGRSRPPARRLPPGGGGRECHPGCGHRALMTAARCVEDIARGEIPPAITEP